jgi:hypothetical protein
MATFEDVLKDERAQIFNQREIKEEPEGVGLAFSGGGIRSATFNLGILQGLAKAKLLDKIQYLSTVSGGGYIGSWLISWILRTEGGVSKVQELLGDYPTFRPDHETAVEPEQVNFLRDYSNYMTPRLGIFGADTWAAIATYIRNVLLNQLILIGFLSAIVLIPWCVLTTSHALSHLSKHDRDTFVAWTHIHSRSEAAEFSAVLAGLLLILAVCWASAQGTRSSYTRQEAPNSAGQNYVLGLVVLPLFASAIFTMIALWLAPPTSVNCLNWWQWSLIGALIYGVVHTLGVLCRFVAILRINSENHSDAHLTSHQWILIPITAAFAGVAGGLILDLLNGLLGYWRAGGHGFAHAMTWGPAIFVAAFLLTGGLHVGLLKILIQNEEQEWWGRAGGLLLLLGIAWTVLFALTIFVPWLFATEHKFIEAKAIAAIAWVASTAFGVISGKSTKTSGTDRRNSAMEIATIVTPYIFVVGLMILLSCGVFWVAENKWTSADKTPQTSGPAFFCDQTKAWGTWLHVVCYTKVESAPADGKTKTEIVSAESNTVAGKVDQYWSDLANVPAPRVVGYFFIFLALSCAVAFRVDINIFSMNLLYRNRLVRCYLGASRRDCNGQPKTCDGRHPNPFTGFDPADDVPLALFRKGSIPTRTETGKKAAKKFQDKHPYTGPYPIVCAALNVTHGERLAWQERKAESFVFTPRYCGFEFEEMRIHSEQDKNGGYQPTEEYAYPEDEADPSHAGVGGVHLGTAVSISGAAASPNMGFHTSPPLAFLMTVFNVRLGWWLANSRYTYNQDSILKPTGGPRFSLLYLLKELFASTTDRSNYIYLSDGGHFENLAVYELIRRRCKYIIACDADADEKVQFEDLGNMIRKCRSDFGVEIDIDTAKLQPIGNPAFSQAHGVVGEIYYPPAPGKDRKARKKGYVLYIKPAITPGVPRDVLAYRDSHPPFPFQTTADQWFDESQFESYRRLGLFSFDSIMKNAKIAGDAIAKANEISLPEGFPRSIEELIMSLYQGQILENSNANPPAPGLASA